MSQAQPTEIFLKDYQEPDYWITHVDLAFDLHPTKTQVRSTLSLKQNESAVSGVPLVLHGEHLKLLSVTLDGAAVGADAYEVTDTLLTVPMGEAETSTLVIETEISPEANSALNGLYMSDGLFCTQCEAEGFRRITYYLDRPDVMATFNVKLTAERAAYPVLLSNGNCLASGDLEDGRHWAHWSDPHPKPAYLFAIVAGDLGVLEDSFTTKSGRPVDLKIFAEPGKQDRCTYAMDALKRSMVWEEERFGLEYDLDIFMIVAVNAFNAGAMENKGLNVFNDKYILADPETATDADYENIEGVVAHEYFHNWTGNRITCRDWFQLCLKEGLTVFRDQEFTSDMRSRAVKRIEDVRLLRMRQFPEDAGPLSHPVRPTRFIEVDNFFTSTVYEKGAELFNMMRTLVGAEGFSKGVSLYFERHDGTAATVEQFVSAMADANHRDLSHFLDWFSQSGTPEVSIEIEQDIEKGALKMRVRQETRPTADQSEKHALHMPMVFGLLDDKGKALGLSAQGERERSVELTKAEHVFEFQDIFSPVTPSVFRDFSSPVKVKVELSDGQRALLMGNDTNPFNRWDSGNQFTLAILQSAVQDLMDGKEPTIPKVYLEAVSKTLAEPDLDDGFKALTLALPTDKELAHSLDEIYMGPVHQAGAALRKTIASQLGDQLGDVYSHRLDNKPYSPDARSAGRRSLKNGALKMLCAGNAQSSIDLARTQFRSADNMTDSLAALEALAHNGSQEREDCLSEFYARWANNPLVIDKWLRTQALSSLPGTFEQVQALTQDEVFTFDKPNKIYALIGAFAHGNLLGFHREDGAAYEYITDLVLDLDKKNPEVSAGLMESFSSWQQMETRQRDQMRAELERVAAQDSLSKNLFEIVHKTLGTTN